MYKNGFGKVRLCARWIVESPPFDPTILFLIVCNGGVLAMQNPRTLVSYHGGPPVWMVAAESIFTAAFMFECFSKICAYKFMP